MINDIKKSHTIKFFNNYELLEKFLNTGEESSNTDGEFLTGGSVNKYKKTDNKITIMYNKKKYTRVIYINNRKQYVKVNKTFILLSKLKKI